jgi:asparagine synthetase B (glutamine-hydrolysing)
VHCTPRSGRQGTYINGRAVLGHRRLSIIDTSAAGHQPFADNGGRYTIAFNGEVFNFQELRAGLKPRATPSAAIPTRRSYCACSR